MMKGKRLCDISHTIIALAQCTPFSILHSVYNTLGIMLKTGALKALLGLGNAGVEEDTTSKENE